MLTRFPVIARIAPTIAILLVVAACAGQAAPEPVATPVPAATSVAASTSPSPSLSPTTAPTTAAPGAVPPSTAPAVVLAQAWATAALVDVSTGETFRIADHAGKVILIESMAIWCSNCRAQQGDVMAALRRLPADSVVYVVLDVDPNEDGASLAAYRERNGFDGRYAIAGNDVGRALAADFGDQFLNPPSTPIAIVGTDGQVTLTEYGHKSPDEIVALAEAHGA
jgi:thiol-disulfide isomerase/thioredoxin